MAARPFVLTGSPGTDLASSGRWLTELGAPCGSEEIFHPAAFERGGTLFWPPSLSGDASWFAAPIVDRLPAQCIVLHQTCPPLRAIQTLAESSFFTEDTPSKRFAEDFLDEPISGDPIADGARLWIQWNRMISAKANASDVRYLRFSEDEIDGHGVCEMLALLGVVRSHTAAQEALDARSPRASKNEGIDFDAIEPPALRAELMAAARGFSQEIARATS